MGIVDQTLLLKSMEEVIEGIDPTCFDLFKFPPLFLLLLMNKYIDKHTNTHKRVERTDTAIM